MKSIRCPACGCSWLVARTGSAPDRCPGEGCGASLGSGEGRPSKPLDSWAFPRERGRRVRAPTVTDEPTSPRRGRSWIGLARGSGIAFGVVAIALVAVTIVGIVLREMPTSADAAHPGITIEAVDAGVQHERVDGVVARIDGKVFAITTLSKIRALRTAGATRVQFVPAMATKALERGPPVERTMDDCVVRADCIEQWIEGSPAGKGEEVWGAVGRGSVIDLAWWPLQTEEGLSVVELGTAPADGAELTATSSSGAVVAARCRALAPQPAAMALQTSAGSPILDPGTPWIDADGALAAVTVESPSIEERTRRGVASPATWSDLHAIPVDSLRRLVAPMSTSTKPMARVLEAAEARAPQPAAPERAARLQWLIAASAAEGFAALASASDRVATLPVSATTLELLPRPVDGEARVIVWPELSDMVDLDVVSTDPAIRLVAVPGVKGRMLEVRDGGGQPAVLPAGRPVSISIKMSLMGKPIGGAVRAMLLGRDPDASATQRRIPGGTPPAPVAPPSTPATAPVAPSAPAPQPAPAANPGSTP
ncbi:MAG: hypothetical protein RL527_2000 [Planctomycetota bacterium]